MSTKKNQNEPGKKFKVGDKLTRIGGVFYKPWAAKSAKKGFVLCTWCNSEFLSKNAGGKKGHEASEQHQKKEKEYKDAQSKNLGNTSKERGFISNFRENIEKTKLFEYKLLSLCLGTINKENLLLEQKNYYRFESQLQFH